MSIRWAVTGLLVTAVVAPARAAGPFARTTDESIDLGRHIFVHDWSRPESWSGSPAPGAGGDGLGPMFNAVSCAACHQQGGPGGAGGNDHNVEILSVVVPRHLSPPQRDALLDRAHKRHPLFDRQSASFVLHRYGYGDGDDLLEYTFWREQVLGADSFGRRMLSARHPRRNMSGIPLEVAYRNTPPLWGLGLIEEIRIGRGHRIRRELVQRQQRDGSTVSGRIPQTPDGTHGWYGWRGHVATLREFVLNACANELGLEVPGRSQPANPIAAASATTGRDSLDLTRAQVTALAAHIAHLPRPVRVVPGDPLEHQSALAGERVFHRIGCSDCHVETVGEVVGLYSDLLLHDMGPRTSDQATSIPEEIPARRITRSAGGYSGGSFTLTIPAVAIPTNIDQEWRTPPLWGVADSAPYFHDGRAPTLDAAIREHDGEAALAAREYDRLFDDERRQLLAFLGTLRAPSPSSALKTSIADSTMADGSIAASPGR